jgi:MATE family multidrug resistance protein
MIAAPAQLGRPVPPAGAMQLHVRETLAITAPIALALLSEMAMGLISTMMLGGLGPQALAAGGLAINLFITALLILQGVLGGVGVLAATAMGAGRTRAVAEIYWSGVLLAAVLAAPLFVLLSLSGALLRACGEPGQLAADVAAYLRVLRWGVPAGIVGIGMMRQFLPAIGLERVLVWVMPGGVLLHFGLSRWLIGGGLFLPAYGAAGSAAAIVITLSAVACGMLVLLHGRNFRHLVGITAPRLRLLASLLAIGLPVGATVSVEVMLFLATAILVGVFGPAALAAHMIALSVTSVSFMMPLALSQTANVRVATAIGAGHPAEARRAGFCAIALGIAFMGSAALLLVAAPDLIVRLYLGGITPQNADTAAIAVKLLGVAAVFQMADGTQVTATGALRGLRDVRVPMLLAGFGYWGAGFWAGWYLAFRQHLGAVGLWWGLCIGLSFVAICLTARFAVQTRRLAEGGPQPHGEIGNATSLRRRKGSAKGGS